MSKHTWQFIASNLSADVPVVLLYVVESSGSSPGRMGFSMAVNQLGDFTGTIGGGIMEVKLIELAKRLLMLPVPSPKIKQQYHDKKHAKNQSGMICSGAQTVVLMPLNIGDQPTVLEILKGRTNISFHFSPNGFELRSGRHQASISIQDENNFDCVSPYLVSNRIHIFGGGHVGLALCRQMSLLGYEVCLYDDRPLVLEKLAAAWETNLVSYDQLKANLDYQPSDAAVIVSFSYRADKQILKELYRLPFSYLGMMGSDAKIATLRKELLLEGITDGDLAHVFMPIGAPIYSKTASEIATSIAAQIILEKNKTLPNGRNYKL